MNQGGLWSKQLVVIIKFVLVVVNTVTVHGNGNEEGTCVGFYSRRCPRAESIVTSTVETHLRSDPSLAGPILRMHFHDCFVRGCDASILIAGSNTERSAGPNLNLRGYEVIDDAKAKLEALCPGVVSCADILAIAARDSVVLSGGLSWQVPTGRKDGRVSIGSEAFTLPGPNDSVAILNDKFLKKGLNTEDLVLLSGGHTIGTSACQFFADRIYNSINGTDPSIDPSFLPFLRQICPQNEPRKRVALDTGSQFKFDTSYFAHLTRGRGILRSDQVLWTDASTRRFVQKYLAAGPFNVQFGKSMIKMSNIGVKTGSQGEIRNKCSAIN